jgi:hypothetical protein
MAMHKVHMGLAGEVSATITPERIVWGIARFADETTRDDFDSDEEFTQQIAIMVAREMWHEMIDASPAFVSTDLNIEWVEGDDANG